MKFQQVIVLVALVMAAVALQSTSAVREPRRVMQDCIAKRGDAECNECCLNLPARFNFISGALNDMAICVCWEKPTPERDLTRYLEACSTKGKSECDKCCKEQGLAMGGHDDRAYCACKESEYGTYN